MHRSDHVERLEAREVLRVDHLQVRDGVRDATVAGLARLLDAIQRFAHRAVADGVDVHQPATSVGGIDQFAKVRRIGQQLAVFVRVLVGLQHRGGLRREFRHAISEHLDPRQGQVGNIEELPAHLVQFVEVGRSRLRIGDQQRCDMRIELVLLCQRLVDRQYAHGLVGQRVARRVVGGRVHPGGDAKALVVVDGGAGGVQQLLVGDLGHLVEHGIQTGFGEEAVGLAVLIMADGVAFLRLQRRDPRSIHAGAGQHGAVGPAGVLVPAEEDDRLAGPFALIEALEGLEVAPGCRGQSADEERVALPGLAALHAFAQALFQLGDRQLLTVEVHLAQLQAALYRVGVGVDEARHQHLAAEIEHACRRLLQAHHFAVGTDRQHLAVLHRHRLLQRLVGFGGVDLGVVQDQIDSGHSFQWGTDQGAGQQQGEKRLHGVAFFFVSLERRLTKRRRQQNAISRTTSVPVRNR
ncbi:hypothetical protein D9M71_320670 [compost metagenome]